MKPGLPLQECDNIEPDGEPAVCLDQEIPCGSNHAALLRRMDGRLRPAKPRTRPGLHLDEDERRAVAGDDVDLPSDRPPVARDDFIPTFTEVSTCFFLRYQSVCSPVSVHHV